MGSENGYNLNEFGSALLIKALEECSEETRAEFAEKLAYIRSNLD